MLKAAAGLTETLFMTGLATLLLVWLGLAGGATVLVAALMSGARRTEAAVLAVPGVPAQAPSLVAMGIALPAPRAAVHDEVTLAL